MTTDVAIVGAGPGGAWAACSLARRGAKVLLFDPSHPREKPCGGGVTGRALDLVAGVLDPARIPRSVIRSARFVDSSTGLSASVSLEGSSVGHESPLIVASRTAIDHALVEAACQAGAELVTSRVTDVVMSGIPAKGFQIRTAAGTHSAGRLIGADGATSLVRRRLAGAFRRDQLSIATGYFAHGVTSDEIVIELASDPPGYVWSFPRPTHLAIGVCAQADAGVTAEALRARVLTWIRSTAVAPGAGLEAYSWPIPSLAAKDFDRLAPGGPGWCLVGDAAGLVDPITREGIYFALLSGQWVADALASDADDWWRTYAERVRDEITADLARAARYRAGFFRPEFTRLLMLGLRQSAAIRDVMADLVAGRQDYAHLKSRLLQTFEVGLALRLARSYLFS
jgi:flavin-dependent dehydrogenase